MCTRVIQIVTGLPPRIDGVGEYALQLARALRQYQEVHTHFLVGDPLWDGPRYVEGFTIDKVLDRTPRQFEAALNTLRSQLCQETCETSKTLVLLQMSAYGYNSRGCPMWLINGLQQWLASTSNVGLLTMFHEISAFGPPWTSAFWLAPLQRSLAKRIAHESDELITSNSTYAALLRDMCSSKQVTCLPIFSTVGEPTAVDTIDNRTRRLVVFGGRGTRTIVYAQWSDYILRACSQLRISKILDIGPEIPRRKKLPRDVEFVETGTLPPSEVSKALLTSYAGFVGCPLRLLGKSTVFAAYCAHGLVPIVASSTTSSQEQAPIYWSITDEGPSPTLDQARAISRKARSWYLGHTVARHASMLAALLKKTADAH